jgi:hypothetical protein
MIFKFGIILFLFYFKTSSCLDYLDEDNNPTFNVPMMSLLENQPKDHGVFHARCYTIYQLDKILSSPTDSTLQYMSSKFKKVNKQPGILFSEFNGPINSEEPIVVAEALFKPDHYTVSISCSSGQYAYESDGRWLSTTKIVSESLYNQGRSVLYCERDGKAWIMKRKLSQFFSAHNKKTELKHKQKIRISLKIIENPARMIMLVHIINSILPILDLESFYYFKTETWSLRSDSILLQVGVDNDDDITSFINKLSGVVHKNDKIISSQCPAFQQKHSKICVSDYTLGSSFGSDLCAFIASSKDRSNAFTNFKNIPKINGIRVLSQLTEHNGVHIDKPIRMSDSGVKIDIIPKTTKLQFYDDVPELKLDLSNFNSGKVPLLTHDKSVIDLTDS